MDARERTSPSPLLPLAVFVVLAAAAFAIWRLRIAADVREGAYERAQITQRLADRAARMIQQQAQKATALAQRFQKGAIADDAAFNAAVISETPGAIVTAAWIGRDGVCELVWSRGAESVLRRGENLKQQALWNYELWRAQTRSAPRVVDIVRDRGPAQMLVVAPAISGEGTSAAYLGCVALRIDLPTALLHLVPAGSEADYDVDLSDGSLKLFEAGQPIDTAEGDVNSDAVVTLNRYLRLRVRPTAAVLARQSGQSAIWVLLVGLAAAGVVTVSLSHALRRRWQTGVQARRQVAALGSLMQTAGVISAVPGAATEALGRLAESARQLLGMANAAISVVDQALDTVTVIAHSGGTLKGGRTVYPLSEAVGTRECMNRGEVIVIEDARNDSRINRLAFNDYGIRSCMFVPLTLENKPIGVMFLGHTQTRTFSDSDTQLAQVLGAQAGVILANLRLYEQKDAALAAQKDLTHRHDKLFQIAAEIYRGENLHESLQRLTDAAPAFLGVDLCVVNLRSGEDQTEVAAITADYAHCKGERHAVKNTNFERVWRDRRTLVVADVPNDPTIHPAFRHRLHMGSVAYLPLIGPGDEVIGTITLVRHVTGSFTEEQLELAEVLAARAAEAIATAKLHEGVRSAAQVQQMLLRELNHRVKNNLATIVALFSIDRPHMPREAQAWVNRLTERIATMARTHELFVGGTDQVDLRELVARLLPGLSVITPPGAQVKLDVPDLGVKLGTQRAVSLAMVLNELCWNALEHGTAENGTLHVRAAALGGGRLALEVQDEGKGHHGAHASDGENGRGVGLRLVRGLVSRELRGRLELTTSEAGGTTARIEIPLDQAEG